MLPFQAFPKIGRFSREMLITEKLDGTNAQVTIVVAMYPDEQAVASRYLELVGYEHMYAGSRTRWLGTSSKDDNYGFAKWVQANADELWTLGPGHHFGEWWGPGIKRGYGVKEKRFSLFNVGRWVDKHVVGALTGEKQSYAPGCCRVVPVLYRGPFDSSVVDTTLNHLENVGSYASPGFMRPEGIVVFHSYNWDIVQENYRKRQ